MKIEESEQQNHIRIWLTVVSIFGLLVCFYLFVGPFLLVLANGNRTFLDWVTGGPQWLENGWSMINHSIFVIQSESELYHRYIGWVVEITGT